jgi:malate dehydrogenase (oxaloacetate-decarboxylating)
VSLLLAQDSSKAYSHSIKGNTIAVVSDGSAVLGLGNIGPYGALPVMEGKALLFKEFGNVDAYPIVLSTQNTEEIIKTVKAIAPTFGGINLEDISAPRCFEIEERLIKELDIPIFHDDQHGTAIVVLAALMNSLRLAKKKKEDIKIVISGAGAAGIATTKLLIKYGIKNIILVDSKGIVSKGRKDLNEVKIKMLAKTNPQNIEGDLREAIKGADVFIGVSAPSIFKPEFVKLMSAKAIIFAMANPVPRLCLIWQRKPEPLLLAQAEAIFPIKSIMCWFSRGFLEEFWIIKLRKFQMR